MVWRGREWLVEIGILGGAAAVSKTRGADDASLRRWEKQEKSEAILTADNIFVVSRGTQVPSFTGKSLRLLSFVLWFGVVLRILPRSAHSLFWLKATIYPSDDHIIWKKTERGVSGREVPNM